MLSIPLLNEVSRRVASDAMQSVSGGTATIRKVRLGLRKVTIDDVVIWSPTCQQPTLAIKQISVDLSVLAGIRHGVWVEKLVVDEPVVHLQFDHHGTLVTHIPTLPAGDPESEPVTSLPFRQVVVRNARFAVHQTGRESLDIANADLLVLHEAGRVFVRGEVPELLSASLKLQSKIDLVKLESESELSVLGVQVSSGELARWPLIPDAVDLHTWEATSSLELTQSGSLTNLQQAIVKVAVDEFSVSTPERTGIVNFRAQGAMVDGSLKLQSLGELLGGTFGVDGTFEFDGLGTKGDRIDGVLSANCSGVSTEWVPNELLPAEVQGKLESNTKLSVAWRDGLLHLDGDAWCRVHDVEAYEIVIAPTTTNVKIAGALDLAGQQPTRSTGMISATVVSDGVSIEQLQRFAERSSEGRSPIDGLVQSSGQVRGAAEIKIPLTTLAEPASYAVIGTIDASGVQANGVSVAQGRGVLQLQHERLRADFRNLVLLDIENGEQSSCSLIAKGRLASEAPIRIECRLDRLSLATAARLANIEGRQIEGEVRAHTVMQCPANLAAEPTAWLGDATLQVAGLRVDGLPVANCQTRCRLSDGRATLHELTGTVVGGLLRGDASCGLTTPFAFTGDVAIEGVDLGIVAAAASQTPVEGRLSMSLQANGAVASSTWRAIGSANGTELRIGSRTFDPTRLDFVATPNMIVAGTPPKGLFGGSLSLELKDFMPETRSAISVDSATTASTGPTLSGKVHDISLPAVMRLAGVKERVEGDFSCDFTASSLTSLEAIDAVTVITSPGIMVRNSAVKQLEAKIALRKGIANADLSAAGFGGELKVEATANAVELAALPADALQQFASLPVTAQAVLSEVRLQEVWPAIGQRDALRPLRGSVTATLTRGEAERQNGTVAKADIKINDLRWDNVLWSNQLQSEIVLGEKLVDVRRFTGQFAGGRVNGRGRVTLDDSRNGTFELTTSSVALQKALVPIDRRGQLATGLMSMRLQGRLGRRPSGRAVISMDRGTAGPIAMSRLRVPVDWSLDPAAKAVQWRTTNAAVELGGGRVVTNAKGRWNGKLDMSLTSTARRVDTGRILKGNSSAGGGFLDGTVRLSAKRATDANDFKGTFDATLSDASSLELPVVSDLTKFLTTIPSTTSFDESRIQGRLGNGIVNLDRVTMAAANAQLLAEGTATLQGRLNLQVMVKTDESGPADKFLELADSPLLMAAPTPIGLVAKANDALKNRVVHLRIGGTGARPVIRLEPGRQIGQEAIKFFMNQAIAFRNSSDELSFR